MTKRLDPEASGWLLKHNTLSDIVISLPLAKQLLPQPNTHGEPGGRDQNNATAKTPLPRIVQRM